jgi:hypothetical protein
MDFSPRRRGILNREIHEQHEKVPDRLNGLAFPLTLNSQPSTGSALCLCVSVAKNDFYRAIARSEGFFFTRRRGLILFAA